MTARPARWDWKLWLGWIVAGLAATAGSYALYVILIFGLRILFAGHFPTALYSIIYYAVPGLLFGVAVGVTQWFVLRRRIARAGRWVWASIVGWTLGWLGHDLLWGAWRAWMGAPPRLPRASAAYVAAVLACVVAGRAIAGAVAGGSQWLVLRRATRRAGWWVPASAAGAVLNGFCIAEC